MEHHQHIRQHYLSFWNANNPANNNNNEGECRELVLKTKEYHYINEQTPGEEVVDEDDPSNCCTICFVPLEEGDRIGALNCNHIFHVECIKGWVQRKNTCPLCAIPLATPRKKRNQRNQPAVASLQDNNV
jgi:hypothetical protein